MNSVIGLLSGCLSIIIFLASILKGAAGRIEQFYPKMYFGIAKVCDNISYVVVPMGCAVILTIGWNFAPIGWYFAWLGVFACVISLIVQAIRDERDYNEINFDNLAFDILIVLPLYLLFFFGTVIFLFAIFAQSLP